MTCLLVCLPRSLPAVPVAILLVCRKSYSTCRLVSQNSFCVKWPGSCSRNTSINTNTSHSIYTLIYGKYRLFFVLLINWMTSLFITQMVLYNFAKLYMFRSIHQVCFATRETFPLLEERTEAIDWCLWGNFLPFEPKCIFFFLIDYVCSLLVSNNRFGHGLWPWCFPYSFLLLLPLQFSDTWILGGVEEDKLSSIGWPCWACPLLAPSAGGPTPSKIPICCSQKDHER